MVDRTENLNLVAARGRVGDLEANDDLVADLAFEQIRADEVPDDVRAMRLKTGIDDRVWQSKAICQRVAVRICGSEIAGEHALIGGVERIRAIVAIAPVQPFFGQANGQA